MRHESSHMIATSVVIREVSVERRVHKETSLILRTYIEYLRIIVYRNDLNMLMIIDNEGGFESHIPHNHYGRCIALRIANLANKINTHID